VNFKVAITETYPQIPCKVGADSLGYKKHTLETTGLEASANKTKYMVMPQDWHDEQNYNIKLGYKSCEIVTVQRFGTNVTNQKSIH
jgi:hypothetical protein